MNIHIILFTVLTLNFGADVPPEASFIFIFRVCGLSLMHTVVEVF